MMSKKQQTQSTGQHTVKHALTDAPKEVQLAVDLIYLLETNNVDPELALAALEIVKTDLQVKLQRKQDEQV
ncbi:pleiotropic regulatory protein RsmS [Photobacterium halotolerans]|uniref:Pleiotropic regulatory protein RsmS n=1 Tax=Photobacterium halotolerans TaxID=265726 RepID=A0A7X4Y087_9GAMM|nr:pleiotropic regulatory protein RsmS [Photobacterium halotolerans]NAW65323.1 pleiotropic regulatory protein RsmS [Photobacterium halotolerans]NAW85667.1 pleiotropic regulatory protein RsmS [Photobacterium halotolerans]NAX48534.1 pleiotropic regulatory protein RsmS [Photobacterium halotolerans]